MAKIPVKVTNERRDRVWFLMLKGYNPPSIIKELNARNATIYKDIKFLTEKSKEYVYDMAKGTHVLMYQRAIEGIALALTEAWNKYNDPTVPEKQKVSYLRLTKECNESMFDMTANGVSVLALKNVIERANRLGIDHTPLEEHDPLVDQHQCRPLINSSNSNNNDIPLVWKPQIKDNDNLNLNTDESSELG
jgi:hypothetical protein